MAADVSAAIRTVLDLDVVVPEHFDGQDISAYLGIRCMIAGPVGTERPHRRSQPLLGHGYRSRQSGRVEKQVLPG